MRHVVLPTRGRRCSRQTVLLLALALLAPATAFAQISEPLHFGVGGGFAVPTGNNPNDLETGFQIEAAIQAGPHYLPVTLRLEALFGGGVFNHEDGAGAARSGGETGPVELRLWQLPARRPVR